MDRSKRHAIEILQRLALQCLAANNEEGYRILSAAVDHVLGYRASTVGPEYDSEAI